MNNLFRAVALALAGTLALAGDATGDARGGLEALKGAVAKNPGDPQSAARLGAALLELEEFGYARATVTAALAKNPQSASLKTVLGDIDFREGHIFEAEKNYKAAFSIDRKNARAMFGVARVFRTASMNAKAELLIKAAHALAPDDPEIAAAITRLGVAGPDSVSGLEAQLADVDKQSRIARSLTARIAELKILNGRKPCELATPYQDYRLTIRPLVDGKRFTGYGLTAAFNDAKSELRLDTGASGIVITRKLAERANIQKVAESGISGIGNSGERAAYIGFVERVRIGDVELRNCLVGVSDRDVDDSGGLIGTDIFRRFLVTLDFRRSRIVLGALPGPSWDGYTPVDRFEGPDLKSFAQVLIFNQHLLIPTKVGDDLSGLFLLDTGSSTDIISTNLAPRISNVHGNPFQRVKGVSGEVRNVYEADQVRIEFAGFRRNAIGVTVFDLSNISRWAGAEVAGIIGIPVLNLFNLTLDYRDGMVKFDYLAK